MMMQRRPFPFLVILLFALLITSCNIVPQSWNNHQEINLYNIDPVTLDPAVTAEATSNQYVQQIFSGLVRLDASLKPAPDLAESWQKSTDGCVYSFRLRKNARFSDGRPVTAADLKYSWERAASPAVGSQTAATFLGDIAGVADVVAGRAKEITGVKVVSDYELQVTITAPRSYFLAELTYPVAYVVNRENVAAGADWWQQPVGTGPFKLKQWDKSNLLVLERNTLYYRSIAKIQTINYWLWSGVPMNLYETGKIDVTGVPSSYIDKVTDKNGGFASQLQESPELSFFYIGFNHTKPPFDDVNIRRAFIMAINKNRVVSLVFRDTVQPAGGILPPGIPGFNKNLTALKYDVAEAKRLIAGSNYGDVTKLPPLTLTTSGRGGSISRALESIITDWRTNLGIEVRVRQMEPEQYFYNVKEEKDNLFDMGWVADYAHPQDFLDVLFASASDNNFGQYHNPEVDNMLTRASLEADEKASLALYQQAEQQLVEDAACIPLWFGKNISLVKPYVSGYQPNPLGYVDMTVVTVANH